METMELEQAKITFVPSGTKQVFALADLAHMETGTKIEGLIVMHGDAVEYYEGTLEATPDGLMFVENET